MEPCSNRRNLHVSLSLGWPHSIRMSATFKQEGISTWQRVTRVEKMDNPKCVFQRVSGPFEQNNISTCQWAIKQVKINGPNRCTCGLGEKWLRIKCCWHNSIAQIGIFKTWNEGRIFYFSLCSSRLRELRKWVCEGFWEKREKGERSWRRWLMR